MQFSQSFPPIPLTLECTYSHFQSSPNCPCCNRILSENDFTELVVAEPSAKVSTTATCFQNIFTKQNSQSQCLSFQDLCGNIMRRNEDLRAGTKFVMKQFLLESSKQHARSRQTIQLLEKLRQENTALKQAQNSQRPLRLTPIRPLLLKIKRTCHHIPKNFSIPLIPRNKPNSSHSHLFHNF